MTTPGHRRRTEGGATARISNFTPDGKFIKSWGRLACKHGEFRMPHALMFDSRGRLWVADRLYRPD